jgi:hypothetical protein
VIPFLPAKMLLVDTRHVKAKFLTSVEIVKTDKFLAKRGLALIEITNFLTLQ